MERKSQVIEGSSIGSRQGNMNKSFNLAIRSLLTACSKQDICKAFSSFTTSEQEHLYRLFIRSDDKNLQLKEIGFRNLRVVLDDPEEEVMVGKYTEMKRIDLLVAKVVTSLHGSIEEGFRTVCLETQVGTALDTVEQLVEEQALDPLGSDKTNVMDVAQNVLSAKKKEVEHLTNMLQMAEKQNQLLRARVEALKKGAADASSLRDTVEMVRRGSSNYALHSVV